MTGQWGAAILWSGQMFAKVKSKQRCAIWVKSVRSPHRIAKCEALRWLCDMLTAIMKA